MCGIAGIYSVSDSKKSSTVRRMTDRLHHRGPDDEGFFEKPEVSLGNRRLSIIDLSATGHQPMANEDGTIWITFNGEIYNYLELIPELKAKGHTFRSHSDTEVILHAYEMWGEACVTRLNGMWAFAIWDDRRKRLFCSRDHFGIKPFYYARLGNAFVFSSEIKALLEHPGLRREPNDHIVYDYLAYGFHDHTAETFFRGVEQLEPAHSVTVGADGVSIRRYWDIDERRVSDPRTDDAYADELRDLLLDSVRIRLRSDVPVGTCLSGGIDSTAIVCLADELRTDRTFAFNAFTAAFDDPKIDERRYVAETAARVGCRQFLAFPSADGLLHDLSDVVRSQDEPFISTSIFAQYELMRIAHGERMKVLLDGQGSDELFAGYPDYRPVYAAQAIRRGAILEAVHAMRNATSVTNLTHLAYYLFPQGLARSLAAATDRGAPRYLHRDFVSRFRSIPHPLKKFPSDVFKNYVYANLTRTGLRHLLHYEDRNSMAFSIETRLPFLDPRVVEFAFALPNEQALRGPETKYVLRNALRDRIPETIRTRRDKLGFPTPELEWLRGPLRPTVLTSIRSPRLAATGYVQPEAVERLATSFFRGYDALRSHLWRIVNLERWLATFMAGENR